MTLPTVQPVDWPDWGVVPTFTTAEYNVAAVVAPNEILFEQHVGYFSYAMLRLAGDGDGENYAVKIQWMTATTGEGGSVIAEQIVVRVFESPVVVPMSIWAPVIRIIDYDATAYPHNVLASLTLFSSSPFQTGYDGGVRVMMIGVGVGATSDYTALPLGVAPGRHQLQITTTSAAFDIFLRTWFDANIAFDQLLCDETTPMPILYDFIPPASAWAIYVVNNDATPQDFQLIINRVP